MTKPKSKMNQYVRWGLEVEHSPKMVIDRVLDDSNGLKICLKNSLESSNGLAIVFGSYACYVNTDESYRYKTIINLPKGFSANSFYIVENSSLVKWIHMESCDIYSYTNMTHYSIITISDWFDVVSEFPPEISTY